MSNETFKIILVVASASSRYRVFGAGLLGSLQETFWLLSRGRATQKALTEHTRTLSVESKDAGWKGRNSARHTRKQRLGTGPAPRIWGTGLLHHTWNRPAFRTKNCPSCLYFT